jgi:hypothetical protein
LDLPAEAEQHFRKAIQQPRDTEDPRIAYGAFLFRKGRTAEVERAVKLEPGNFNAHVPRSRALTTAFPSLPYSEGI